MIVKFFVVVENSKKILFLVLEHVKTLYEQFKTKDDDNFNSYISQPFLLASEQDQLIEQLRDKR